MKKFILCLIFTVLYINTTLFASEFYGKVALGAKYNTYIEYLYLEDRMYLYMYEEDIQRKAGFSLISDVEFGFMAGKDNFFTIDFSLFSETGLTYLEYSKFNPYIVVSANYRISNHFSLNFSLTGHYAAENYRDFHSLYVDGHFNINLFYDKSDYIAAYFEIKGGYYHSFFDKIDYLSGPTAMIEAGAYIYPKGDLNYIKMMAGFGYYHFREEEYVIDDVGDIFVQNEYVKPFLQIESEWTLREKFTAILNFQYSYLHLFKEDYTSEFEDEFYPEGEWKKARKEHQLIAGVTLKYSIVMNLDVVLFYQFKHNFSNIGNGEYDYTDYNYSQHLTSVSCAYQF